MYWFLFSIWEIFWGIPQQDTRSWYISWCVQGRWCGAIIALAKSKKPVEKAILTAPVFNNSGQFWSWWCKLELELLKFYMDSCNTLAVLNLIISTIIRNNLQVQYPTLCKSWQLVKLGMFYELICKTFAAPRRFEYCYVLHLHHWSCQISALLSHANDTQRFGTGGH